MKRLRLAISGLTACSGCQLSLLNCETELPQMLKTAEFHYFPMACTPAVLEGYYDAALVEGCLSMPHEHELLLALRERSRYLVAVGTCATWGGVAALRNGEDRELMRQQVYGENRMACDTHDPRPLHTAVKVDADVSGCPPEKEELLRLIAGLMRGALPAPISHTVCSDCRMRENLCLLTECSQLCLGPMTMGGCGARCPSRGVSCEGCRGPAPEANLAAATEIYLRKGYDRATVCERLKRFCPEWKP